MKNQLEFKKNKDFTMGIELELQLINLNSFNLILESDDFLRRLTGHKHQVNLKPEITQSMIEVNSSIHFNYNDLLKEIREIQYSLLDIARKINVGICGGGTHPFQKWKEQKIFKSDRFLSISEQYGYLAKQFTVFGQHIHVSCENGDDALYLCHALAYYIPHFIAISASSPFNQRVDTSFDCSRLSVVSAFPLSGTPPWIFEWEKFIDYFSKFYNLNIAESMKDFYWDIRPKPEYGTIEIRICDTPLTLQKACDIAAYAHTLVAYLLSERPIINHDLYLVYFVNRFRASRFGFNAQFINTSKKTVSSLKEEILHTCGKLEEYACALNALEPFERIRASALNGQNDARWLRQKFEKYNTFEDVVRKQIEIWSF